MNRRLQARLLALAKRDQHARASGRAFALVDRRNTAAMKRLIQSHGWPTIRMVGREAATAAWLIAQHADHDVAFQQDCLIRLRLEARRHQADRASVAYLTDRVQINKHQMQLYGTQFYMTAAGSFRPRPIKNRRWLNARRRRFGLGSFLSYQRRLVATQKKLSSR